MALSWNGTGPCDALPMSLPSFHTGAGVEDIDAHQSHLQMNPRIKAVVTLVGSHEAFLAEALAMDLTGCGNQNRIKTERASCEFSVAPVFQM